MKCTIIGSGINGLVAANYLARAGHEVVVLERTTRIGGACAQGVHIEQGKRYRYALGPTVLGLMQKFVFEETGLAQKLRIYTPSPNEVVHIAPTGETLLREKTRHAFHRDLERVITYLQQGYRDAVPPSLADANRQLGVELTKRWIEGDARSLLDFYFKDDTSKMLHAMCVNESGAVQLDEPFSAFTIPLMYSGSVFNGGWGYVKGGIWQLTRTLKRINDALGVKTVTGVHLLQIDPEQKMVRYRVNGKTMIRKADRLVFTTDPLTAAKLLKDKQLIQTVSAQRLQGTSGKLVLFFRKPVVWADQGKEYDAAFRQILLTSDLNAFDAATKASTTSSKPFTPGYLELYPESAALEYMGDPQEYHRLTVFFKHLSPRKFSPQEREQVENKLMRLLQPYIRNRKDIVASKLMTPFDLKQTFFFPGGNIDHTEIANHQTYLSRTYSSCPEKSFYQFGDHPGVFYAGSGAYPCGSVTGTAGYMCVRSWLDV